MIEGLSAGKRRIFIAVALVVAIVYVVVALATDAEQLKVALVQLGISGCILVLGLSAANYVLRFLRWQYYLGRLGRVLPTGPHLAYYLAGFAFTVSPGKAGEAVRSLYLRDHGVTYTESIAALFVERLLDLCTMVLLASLIVVDHETYRPLLGGVLALALIAVITVCQPIVPRWLDSYGTRTAGRVSKIAAVFANLLRSSRTLLHPRPLSFGMIIGLLSWGAEGIGFYIICHTLHIVVSPSTATGIYAIAALAGSAVFFLPAGIGGMEIVMTTLLVEQGATLRVAIIATLLCRLATLWFAVMLGIASALGIEFFKHSKRIRTAP
jgi:glycosyltransferase 2 family protein